MSRDHAFERDFLECAARDAGLGALEFEEIVLARLVQGAREYGESFLGYSLARFVREIGEEGADVAGWAVGAAQCHELQALDPDRRDVIVHWLLHLASLGARVEWARRQLDALLD